MPNYYFCFQLGNPDVALDFGSQGNPEDYTKIDHLPEYNDNNQQIQVITQTGEVLNVIAKVMNLSDLNVSITTYYYSFDTILLIIFNVIYTLINIIKQLDHISFQIQFEF